MARDKGGHRARAVLSWIGSRQTLGTISVLWLVIAVSAPLQAAPQVLKLRLGGRLVPKLRLGTHCREAPLRSPAWDVPGIAPRSRASQNSVPNGSLGTRDLQRGNAQLQKPQSLPEPALQEDLPIGDEELTNAPIRSRITQKFEIYNPHSAEQLQAVRNMGFTQVILDWPNLHAAATQVGLDVVIANWWTKDTSSDQIEKRIEYLHEIDARRLVAVSMMDEPERHAPETPFSYYQALYRDLRAYFDAESPHVQLEISHWGPLPSWTPRHYEFFQPLYQATDRIRLMPYPDLSEGPLSEVYYQMLRSRRLMRLAGRELPQVVILQTWVLPEEPKLPTLDELRVMAYLAMLAGADTLSFFQYDPAVWEQTAGFAAGFNRLMQELTEFSHRFREAAVESQISPAGLFTATITPPAGSPFSLVINTNRDRVGDLEGLAVVLRAPEHMPSMARVARRGLAGRAANVRRYFLNRPRWACRMFR